MTQLSPQSKFLPLKWSWVFDLPSREDLSSQGCPGVWTRLGDALDPASSARRTPWGSCQGQLSRSSWTSSLQSRLQNPGAPSKGFIFPYLSSKAGGSEVQLGLWGTNLITPSSHISGEPPGWTRAVPGAAYSDKRDLQKVWCLQGWGWWKGAQANVYFMESWGPWSRQSFLIQDPTTLL